MRTGNARRNTRASASTQKTFGRSDVSSRVSFTAAGLLSTDHTVASVGQRRGLIVRDSEGTNLRWRQIRRDNYRDFLHSQFFRRLVSRVAGDDDALAIDHDRHLESELTDRRCHGIHGPVVDAGIVLIRLDPLDGPHLDLHAHCLLSKCGESVAA
jgi:hypothetical protein